MSSLYFDNASTTFPSENSVKVFNATLTQFPANPSSSHKLGEEAFKCLTQAREQVASLLCTDEPSSVVFTSSATEANNIVMQGLIACEKRGRVIISDAEHPSIAENKTILERCGFEVVTLKTEYGIVNKDELMKKLTPDTVLVAIMYVNNVTGAVNDIPTLASTVLEYKNNMKKNILFHADSVQAAGKISINADTLKKCGVTSLSFSGHKFNAPRGCGILLSSNALIRSLSKGGGQENGRRAGTENLAAICSTAASLKEATEDLKTTEKHYSELKATLIGELNKKIGSSLKVLSLENSTPAIVSLSLKGLAGEITVRAASEKGIYIGTTSACSSNAKKSDKKALVNIGYSAQEERDAIRVSFCKDNTKDDVLTLCNTLSDIFQKYHA